MAVGSRNLLCGFIVNQSLGDLSSKFFVLPYRTPAKIDKQAIREPDTCQILDQDSGAGEANPDRIYVPATGDFSATDQVWILDDDTPIGELATIQSIMANDYFVMTANLTGHYATAQNARVCLVSDTVRSWGGILCIDPNGLRPTGAGGEPAMKGPIYFLLDTLIIRPGLTNKAGAFVATINDQATVGQVHPTTGAETRPYDKTLFAEHPLYDIDVFIRDNDEFWVGPQQGPDVPNNSQGLNQSWSPSSGGREWLMGGYITKRYWKVEGGRRITAYIEGRCYMDVWMDQYFGTPATPRNYETATDFATVAADILTDVNAQQDADYQFSQSTLYWPGAGAIPAVTGHEIVKEFKTSEIFSTMRENCEEAGWEWQITPNPAGATPAARRAVMLYPRSLLAPRPTQYLIEYTRNIRHIPKIMQGDTSELVTDIIITDGEVNMVPPNRMAWIDPGVWRDLNYENREYTMLSIPPPPNAAKTMAGGRYTDGASVLDDEGWPAINFQKHDIGAGQFWIFLTFYTDDAGNPVAARMDLDLRQWRRLRFKFKHNSRATPDGGTVYRVGVHSVGNPGVDFVNRAFYYLFGTGYQEGLSPPLSDHDTIDDEEWTELDILLPEIDKDGNVADLNGWTEVTETGPPFRGPDPTSIDFVTFFVDCDEDEPGSDWIDASIPGSIAGKKFVGRRPIVGALSAGDYYLQITNPEVYFQRGTGSFPATSTGETVFYNPKPYCLIGSTGPDRVEPVLLDAMRGSYYPGMDNLRLTHTLLYAHSNNRYLYILGGWSISLSQIRFERNVRLEDSVTVAPHLQNPRRFRLVTKKEIEYLGEAEDIASLVLDELGQAQQFVTPVIDGDPRMRIGYRMMPRLDPGREDVFHSIYMFVDDVQYTVEDVDFSMQVTMGTINNANPSQGSRAKIISDALILGLMERRLREIAMGKTPLTRPIK